MPRIIGNVDDLAATVERRTRSEAKDTLEKARRKADRLREEADDRAEQARQEILDAAQAEADRLHRQKRAEAQQTAQQRRLQAREDHLTQTWQRAEEQLRALVEGDEYADALRRLAWLAVETLGPGRLVLAADPTGHDLLTDEQLNAWSEGASADVEAEVRFERADAPADAWGGLIAHDAERRRRLDATFSTRLALAKEEIREDIFARLTDAHE